MLIGIIHVVQSYRILDKPLIVGIVVVALAVVVVVAVVLVVGACVVLTTGTYMQLLS